MRKKSQYPSSAATFEPTKQLRVVSFNSLYIVYQELYNYIIQFGKGEEVMLKAYEILGTDKPIFKKRGSNHFFLDELVHLNENPENYSVVGYVRVVKNKEVFFRSVWQK